jgi:hypothetical protein
MPFNLPNLILPFIQPKSNLKKNIWELFLKIKLNQAKKLISIASFIILELVTWKYNRKISKFKKSKILKAFFFINKLGFFSILREGKSLEEENEKRNVAFKILFVS